MLIRARVTLMQTRTTALWPSVWSQVSTESPPWPWPPRRGAGQSGGRLCMVRCRWRGTSPSLTSWVHGGGERPPDRNPSSTRWRHPIRAGLVSMKWSWGYRWEQERSPDWRSDGQTFVHGSVQVERHFSKPCEWLIGDTILWLWNGFNTLEEPRPGGCNGGAQRAPLPRWCCSTTHILRWLLTPICVSYQVFRGAYLRGVHRTPQLNAHKGTRSRYRRRSS